VRASFYREGKMTEKKISRKGLWITLVLLVSLAMLMYASIMYKIVQYGP